MPWNIVFLLPSCSSMSIANERLTEVMASLDDHHKANGARLSRLIIDKGTEGVRKVFDYIHPPATLNATLTSYHSFLKGLRYVNRSQMDILFPPSGVASKSEDFDITLLFVLLRNICGLHPPASTGSWDTNPPSSDTSKEANLVRIKYYRNKVYGHITNTGVNDTEFRCIWKDISAALIALGVSVGDLEHLKTSPLDENLYLNQVKDWKEKEEKIEAQNETILWNLKETQAKLDVLSEQLTTKPFKPEEKSRKQGITRRLKNTFICGISKGKTIHRVSEVIDSEKCILDTLVKCDFSGDIRKLNQYFHEGTRKWLLEELYLWLEGEDEYSDSRVLILAAGPGVGKSVFSAKVCQLYAEKGLLAACHFCKFNSADYINPHKMLQSLAVQMCESVKGFREKLTEQLQRDHCRSSVTDAFRVLLKDPLNSLPEQEPMIIVIDALDESELLDLIKEEFSALPAWIKVFITSRPELPVQQMLTHLNAVEILPNNEDNKADLQSYLEFCLKKIDIQCNSLWKLVDRCEGSFLYANHCQLELNQLRKLPANGNVEDFIPTSIGVYYKKYFKRLEKELKTLSEDIDMSEILKVLVAMQGPLPLSFIADILKLPRDTGAMKKVICKVNESLSALLLVYDDCIVVFHKTVVDWLLLSGKYKQHEFVVREKDGHKPLWKACQKIFMELEYNSTNEKKTTAEDYALNHGLYHLIRVTYSQCYNPRDQHFDSLIGNVGVFEIVCFSFGVKFSWYGWVLLHDDEHLYVMTTSQLIQHIEDCQKQVKNPRIVLHRRGAMSMMDTLPIYVRYGIELCVVANSDKDSVLDYVLLKLETSLLGPNVPNIPNPRCCTLHANDAVYGPYIKVTDHFQSIVQLFFPVDLIKWLKVRHSPHRSNASKGIPVHTDDRDIDWDKIEEQKEALIYSRPNKFYVVTSFAGLPLINSSHEVVGMQSFQVVTHNRELPVYFSIRIEKIIEDITKKNEGLARTLFPNMF